MKILFLGSSGALSIEPLKYLLQSEHEVCAVGVAGGHLSPLHPKFPVISLLDESVELLAHESKLPIINFSADEKDVVGQMGSYRPDLVLVSCFARLLSPDVLAIPPLGCYNLHPSRLPAYRGPVPLFWQFRDAVQPFAMTLHKMTARLDAGPIIGQQTVSMPDGIAYQQANRLLAEQGVELLKKYLNELARQQAGLAQTESLASYQSPPVSADFAVNIDWSARRIFNFMRATRNWGQVYPCEIDGHSVQLREAISFQKSDNPDKLVIIENDRITITNHGGRLTVSIDSRRSA